MQPPDVFLPLRLLFCLFAMCVAWRPANHVKLYLQPHLSHPDPLNRNRCRRPTEKKAYVESIRWLHLTCCSGQRLSVLCRQCHGPLARVFWWGAETVAPSAMCNALLRYCRVPHTSTSSKVRGAPVAPAIGGMSEVKEIAAFYRPNLDRSKLRSCRCRRLPRRRPVPEEPSFSAYGPNPGLRPFGLRALRGRGSWSRGPLCSAPSDACGAPRRP